MRGYGISIWTYLDEDTAVIYDGDRRYPLINGEELLEQLWALLPEQ